MAEVFDFGLQQHKIKMDGKFFESNLFAVAGDTGRRLEVQLLDSNNMVQNTTGISLRLNAVVAGQATYAEATLVDATKGLYELDLPNGMLLAPGNWQFQWQIIGTAGEKLHSFAFMGSIGSNLAEGGTEATNFYFNAQELKDTLEQIRADFIKVQQDSTATSPSGAEVVIARGTHDTLGERLDMSDAENELVFSDLQTVKLKSKVSLLDYSSFKTLGPDGFEWHNAIMEAWKHAYTVTIPEQVFLIGDTVRERSNGGARQLEGNNQYFSVLKASSNLNNKPLVWFGNSAGHGNYRGLVDNITLDGGGKTKGNVGLRWHEAGQSTTRDVRIMLCDIAIEALGVIHGIFEGNSMIQGCRKGLLLTKIPTGTPSSLDDIAVTSSPLTLNTNATKIRDIWFSSIDEVALRVEGGLVEIDNCTFQGAISGGANYDVVEIINANESKDYGGGPKMTNCWFEGGSYRFAVAVRNTRAFEAYGNFISGSESRNGTKEGGILLSNSPSGKVTNNSIRGFFDRAPSEGRLGNGGIYVTLNSLSAGSQVEPNYMTKGSVNYYYEGVANPAIAKPRTAHWAVVDVVDGVATIIDASDDSIANVSKQGTGLYTVVYKANRESPLNKYPVSISANTSVSTQMIVPNLYEQNIIYDRFSFKNVSGVNADPSRFTISFYGELRTY